MLNPGLYQTLRVNRISDYGLFLADEEGNEVLLPNRYVSLANKVDDLLSVFVYHDSEDRVVATTEKPYATVGQVAFLEVVDKTLHGAFLDWGLSSKHLFLPNRNMLGGVQIGERYVVYIYRDTMTDRSVCTMALKGYIRNEELDLRRGEQVDIVVSSDTEVGFRVVINNKYWGMIYHNQLFTKISIGDSLKAYVRKITEDNRVDLTLQQEGYDGVKRAADRVLEIVKQSGSGGLAINDDSSPDEVRAATKMSKKVFKRAVGYLLKRELIMMDKAGIELTNKAKAGGGDE